MPLPSDTQVLVLGETNFRNQKERFGIKADDRRRHMYVVGSTGMGKSEFLKNMAIQDIEEGRGLAFLDPHGDSADALLNFIPPERMKDVIYFDPSDLANPIAFNVLDQVEYEYRHLIASGLLGVFKKIWGADAWSGRMEYILNNTILALLEHKDSTLLAINRLMSSKEYRKRVVATLKDPIVKAFWTEEFAKYADKFATEATAAIQNKVGQFASNNVIRNIVGQVKSTIDMRKIMDEGKILIVNLSKGAIGEDASRLIGALLITKIQLAAMSRVDIPESERRDFYLYVDEFQNFATESFANILSEARKYHLCLVVAHQYIKQMEEVVADAVFGNVGTIVTFRVGAEDAEFLEKWYAPDFMAADIVNLGKYNMYMKLMVNGITSKGFSAVSLPPFPRPERTYKDEIIDFSRHTYGTPRDKVEKDIAEWAMPIEEVAPPSPRRQGPPLRPAAPRSPQSSSRPSAPRREPRPSPTHRAFLSSLTEGAVDFQGRKLEEKPPKQKPGADSSELKKIIEEALKK
ncbi:MAG TPA: type IV secretion system DNA-binding domain-containing protein [Candidatus Paceibacterota bacterium]|nr:type IV secretion system DNA-binding domain-containing protein [Candidatus Paceibacterota bacterium]